MTRHAEGAVAVVVTDDLEAVRAVRHGARLARDWDRPLLLLVPLRGSGLPTDGSAHSAASRRRQREAAAVLGRIGPVLGGGAASAQVVTYLPRGGRTPALLAALRAARRVHADVVVAGPRVAGSPGARGLVLVDPASGEIASGQPPNRSVGAVVSPRDG